MDNAIKLPAAVMTVLLAEGRCGSLRPQIMIRMPKDTPYRPLRAALHLLAARIELATPSRESWVVQTDNDHDAVYLELVNGDDAEAQRGMALLRTLAK